MDLNINFNVRFFSNPDDSTSGAINNIGTQIMSALQALAASVALNTTVTESAIALLEGLHARLDEAIAAAAANANDLTGLQALADSLAGETTRLSSAVTANTPAEPAPEAPPADPAPEAPADPVEAIASSDPIVDAIPEPQAGDEPIPA